MRAPNYLIAAGTAAALLAGVTAPTPARALSFSDLPLMSSLFGDTRSIPITESELASVGCVLTGGTAALAALLLGGTAVVATGGAGTASMVAVPVIVGAAAAGCALGSAAAPGLAWISRNTDKLSQRMGQTVDDVGDAVGKAGQAVGNALPIPELPAFPGMK